MNVSFFTQVSEVKNCADASGSVGISTSACRGVPGFFRGCPKTTPNYIKKEDLFVCLQKSCTFAPNFITL